MRKRQATGRSARKIPTSAKIILPLQAGAAHPPTPKVSPEPGYIAISCEMEHFTDRKSRQYRNLEPDTVSIKIKQCPEFVWDKLNSSRADSTQLGPTPTRKLGQHTCRKRGVQ